MPTFNPSGQEQYLLELTNRLRTDPAAELARLLQTGDPQIEAALAFFKVDLARLSDQWTSLAPVPPLAFDPVLWETARAHSALMGQLDLQAHQLPGEASLKDRVAAAGYAGTYVGENIYAYAESVMYAHAGMVIDWGFGPGGIQDPAWHRINLMNPQFRDVGIGILAAPAGASTGPLLVTQDFGRRTNPGPAQLVGVVYRDGDGDGFYSVGEGRGGVTVTVTGLAGTFTTTTWTAGGYQLPLPPGSYTVSFSGGGLAATETFAVTIGSDHVKMDLREEGLPRVQFAGPPGRRGEGVGALRLPLALSQPVSHSVTVRYAVVGGTARAGQDYRAAQGVVTFLPGQTGAWVVIPIINDRLHEAAETLRVILLQPSGAELGGAVAQTWTIVDNDAPPLVTVAAGGVQAGGALTARVALSARSGVRASVHYVVTGGGLDRVGFMTFLPGQRVQRITLGTPRGGAVHVRLVGPGRARLGNPSWCVF